MKIYRTAALAMLVGAGAGCSSSHKPLPTATPALLMLPTPAEDEARVQLPGRSLVIRNARVIDGMGGPALSNTDLWIEEGRIQAIGPNLEVSERPEIDASGLTVLPGLITSHSHVQSVPGSVLRGDDRAAVQKQQMLQLRSYLASGFTTVLDPAIGPNTAKRLRAHVAAGNPGPEILILAPFVTPANGYMTNPKMRGEAFADFWPALEPDTDLDAFFEAGRSLDSVGAKVTIEDGILLPNFPTFSDARLEQIRAASVRQDVRLYVHSVANKDHFQALKLDPYALVHVGLWDEAIDPELLDELVRRGTYVMSTITLNHLGIWGWRPDFKDDLWIRARVPLIQWQTAVHPDLPDRMNHDIAEVMRPRWIPLALAKMAAPLFTPSREDVAEITASGVRAVSALEAAGVPWVVGADEGNSPAYATYFHGVSSQIELEQLDAGGIPRSAILQAVTRTPARMLGVDDRIGTLAVGKEADLIVVRDDPLEHGMVALRTLQWTVSDGQARTPASWLAD